MTNSLIKDLERAQGLCDIINSTIVEEGFYMKLEDGSKVKESEIFGAWRYIHNQCISRLIKMGVMDQYGRLTMNENAVRQRISKEIQIDSEIILDPVYERLRDFIFHYGKTFAMPEWLKVFPKQFLVLPVLQISNQITNQSIDFLRLSERSTKIEMPLMYLEEEEDSIQVTKRETRHSIEIPMTNQFGNPVTIVIRSNSDKVDRHLHVLMENSSALRRDIIIIGEHRKLFAEHKLLCSFAANKTDIIIPRQARREKPAE